MNVLNAAELFIRKWSILCYMNFISIFKKKEKNQMPGPSQEWLRLYKKDLLKQKTFKT